MLTMQHSSQTLLSADKHLLSPEACDVTPASFQTAVDMSGLHGQEDT